MNVRKHYVEILRYNFFDWNTDLDYNSKKAALREKKIVDLWRKKGYIYKRSIQIQNNFSRYSMNFIYDPLVTKATYKLEEIYLKYVNGHYFPNVVPKFINDKKGFGIFAE